ncbi:MAG: hypothetical protein ACR2JH_04995 [Solirubrobacteraceae bacterium]
MSVDHSSDENPFVFDEPLLDSQSLVGRQRELEELLGALRAAGEAVIEGPHAYGKTSLVNVALAALAADDDGLGIRVDCTGVLTVDDFARRLQEAYAQAHAFDSVEGMLVERLEALSLRFSTSTSRSDERVQALLSVAEDVASLADRGAAMCFDDYQDAIAVPAVVEAIREACARDVRRMGYAFVGPLRSERGKIGGPAGWPDRPAIVTVGAIDPHRFAGEVSRRFADTGRDAGEGAELIGGVGAGHPQRTSLLAWQLWELTAAGERTNVASARMAIDLTLRRCTPEFNVRWNNLHSNERRVAVAIANEIAPQGTRAQRATGLSGAGAAQRALQGIKTSGVAQMRGEQVTLTDPLFAEWLRRRYSQIPVEPDWQTLRRQAQLQRGGIRRGM